MKKRVRWLDRCKGIAAVLVVLGHVAAGYRDAGLYPDHTPVLHTLYYVIYAFHMPLFFVLSGSSFCLAYRQENGLNRQKAGLQTVNLVYLYFFFSIVQWAFKWVCARFVNSTVSVEDLLLMPVKPMNPYWYLYVLVGYYLLMLLIAGKSPKTEAAVLAGAVLLSAAVCGLSLPTGFPLKQLLYYAAFFWFGYVLVQQERTVRLLKKAAVFLWLPAAGILLYAGKAQTDLRQIPVIGFLAPMVVSTAVIGLTMRLPELSRTGPMEFLGKHALEIYVVHCFITAGNRVLLPKLGIDPFWLNVTVNTAMATLIPVGVACLMKKLGIHKIVFHPVSLLKKRN